jgi:hypothetical protein
LQKTTIITSQYSVQDVTRTINGKYLIFPSIQWKAGIAACDPFNNKFDSIHIWNGGVCLSVSSSVACIDSLYLNLLQPGAIMLLLTYNAGRVPVTEIPALFEAPLYTRGA